jgi:hypothetical protein
MGPLSKPTSPLALGKFDAVLTPINLEPHVQCTCFLRLKYFVNNHTTVITDKPGEKKPD